MNNVIKGGIIPTISKYFSKEEMERLIELNNNGVWILYSIIRHYESDLRLGLSLDELKDIGCGTVEESGLEALILKGFLIKEDGKYFIPKIYSKEKLRQEKENGQQPLF